MKAWVLHNIGDFRCEEVERPRICDNEVLVAVKAVGICGSDIPRVYRAGAHRMPLIIGHELSGIYLGYIIDYFLGKVKGILGWRENFKFGFIALR